jgi:hypothetical protein
MYIPSLFTTNPNGCPNGFNAYTMANVGTTNLSTGARGRLTVNVNQFTNTVVGENFQGDGAYTTNITLNNGASYNTDGILPPGGNASNSGLPFFGSNGQNQSINYYITSSAGEQLYYCWDCTKKYRWTIASNACQDAPWSQFSGILTLGLLTNPSGSITTYADYTRVNFNFCIGTTGSIEGFGPLWEMNAVGGNGNRADYYIIGQTDITPVYYNIENCLTSSITASISLAGTSTLSVGTAFKSSTSTLSGSCWSVVSSFPSASFTPTYSNVVTASTFAECINCTDPLSIKYNITDCSTSINYVSTFSSIPTIGTIFKSNDLDKCFTIVSQASQSVTADYSNLSIVQTYADCATCLAVSSSLLISSLVVGGGGAGGGYAGGGGGAGQYQAPSNVLIATGSTYPVVVGNGGTQASFKGTNGGSSSFNGVISIGGGAGGALNSGGNPAIINGNSGSSGGGGGGVSPNTGSGGIGSAGNNGGAAYDVTSAQAGGGGGASQIGAGGVTTSRGGNGTQWLDGNYYAGGGGGYTSTTSLSSNGTGGLGGGGNGYQQNSLGTQFRIASSGSANTGGGGGGNAIGSGAPNTWSGGSGVVKIRYAASSSLATGGTITSDSGYIYHTFTGSGNFITL